MTLVTLVAGGTPATREQAVINALKPAQETAVIWEGLPTGKILMGSSEDEEAYPKIIRIAAGCICCTGNLVLRVTLNRLLKRKPFQILIALATDEHIDAVRDFLKGENYQNLIALTEDLRV